MTPLQEPLIFDSKAHEEVVLSIGDRPMKKRFVAVAGNIGVGKSTLVEKLAARLGWAPFYEPVGENPYLSDFYQDMRTWSFHSQIFFLTRRLRAHRELVDHPTSAIQDRTVYEDAEVFAHNLYLQHYMAERDYESYRSKKQRYHAHFSLQRSNDQPCGWNYRNSPWDSCSPSNSLFAFN